MCLSTQYGTPGTPGTPGTDSGDGENGTKGEKGERGPRGSPRGTEGTHNTWRKKLRMNLLVPTNSMTWYNNVKTYVCMYSLICSCVCTL